MTTRADIVAAARSMIGTPFLHQGRAPGIGLDCIGLVGMAAHACGVTGTDEWLADRKYHAYGLTPMPALLWEGCERFLDQIAAHAADVADVLVMRFRRDPQHFALISEMAPRRIVHAYRSIGEVTEQGADIWGARVLRAYRFRGVEA